MSAEPSEPNDTEKSLKEGKDTKNRHKPAKMVKQSHKRKEPSKYQEMKVYSTSNKASRERLHKLIMKSKENSSVLIRWDEILC